MKKIISSILAVLIMCAVLAGCGSVNLPLPGSSASGQQTGASPTQNIKATQGALANPAATAAGATSGNTVANAYSAYITAKGNVLTKIIDAMSSNPDTAMNALSLLGVSVVDLAMLPASFFGLGKQTAEAGLAMFSATDVEYSENGNSYVIKYKDKDNKVFEFKGTYDATKDVLVCTASTDGKESSYSEYRKTSFGYIGQYYLVGDDGTATVYQVSVKGEDGVLGISEKASKPSALTGSETVDFPKACAEWYAISGTAFTGLTSDGQKLSAEYKATK